MTERAEPQVKDTPADALAEGVRLQKAGQIDAAAEIYEQVLADNPKRASAWNLLGTVAIQKRDPERAKSLIRHALSLNTEDPAIHHNLAYMYGMFGQTSEAVAHYREAIRLKPDYAEAIHNLASSANFRYGDPLLENIDELLQNDDLADVDRSFLHFAAGKMLDDMGAYDRAFSHYAAGNKTRNATFDHAGHQYLIDRTISIIDADYAKRRISAAVSAPEDSARRAIFIVGMPRSGTSLAEQILSSHPDVVGAGELGDVASIAGTLPEHAPEAPADAKFPDCLPWVTDAVIDGFSHAYMKRVGGLYPDARRIVDKHPLNFRFVGLILQFFPAATIIHMRRDPRDTCLSCYFQNFNNGQEYAFDLQAVGRFYLDYHRMMDHWRRLLPGRFLDVDYEALVDDAKTEGSRMLTAAGLDWHPDCEQFHKTARPVSTASRWQVRQPIYKTAKARWLRYEDHIGSLLETLAPILP